MPSVEDTEKELVTDSDSKNLEMVTPISTLDNKCVVNNVDTCGINNVDITDVISGNKDEVNKDKYKAKMEGNKNTVALANITKTKTSENTKNITIPKVQSSTSTPLTKGYGGYHSVLSPQQTSERIKIVFNDDQYCTIKNFLVPKYKKPDKMRKKTVQKKISQKRTFKYGSDKVQKTAQEIAKIISAGITLEDVRHSLLPMETYCDKCKKLFFRKTSFNRHNQNSHGYLITNYVVEETGDVAEKIAKKLGISLETAALESNVIDEDGKEKLDNGGGVCDDFDSAHHHDYDSDVDIETTTDEPEQDVHSKIIKPEIVSKSQESVSEKLLKRKLEQTTVQLKNKADGETAKAEPKQVFQNKIILGSVARKSTTKSHTKKPEISSKALENTKETVTPKRDKTNVGNSTVAANVVRNKSEPFPNKVKDGFNSDNTAETQVHKKTVHDVIDSIEDGAAVVSENVKDKLQLCPVVVLEDIKYLLQSARKFSELCSNDELASKSTDCDERGQHKRRRLGFETNSNLIGKKVKYSEEVISDTRSATTEDSSKKLQKKDIEETKVASVKAKIDNSNSKFKRKNAQSPFAAVKERTENKATKSNETDNDASDAIPKENLNLQKPQNKDVVGQSTQCLHCNDYFETKDQLINHMYDVLIKKGFKCEQCNETFETETNFQQHVKKSHKKKATQSIKKPSLIIDIAKKQKLVSDHMDDLEQNQSHKEPTVIVRTKSSHKEPTVIVRTKSDGTGTIEMIKELKSFRQQEEKKDKMADKEDFSGVTKVPEPVNVTSNEANTAHQNDEASDNAPTANIKENSLDEANVPEQETVKEEYVEKLTINDKETSLEEDIKKPQEQEISCNNNKEFDGINNTMDSLTIQQRAMLQLLSLTKRPKPKMKPKTKTAESELLLDIYKKTKKWRIRKKKKLTNKARKVNNNASRQVPKSEVKVYPGRRAAFKLKTENLCVKPPIKVTDVQDEQTASFHKSEGKKRHCSRENKLGKTYKTKRSLSPAAQLSLSEQMSQLKVSQFSEIPPERSRNYLIKDYTSLPEQIDTKEEPITYEESLTIDLEDSRSSSTQLPLPFLLEDGWASDSDMTNAAIKIEDIELEEHRLAEIKNEDIEIEDTPLRVETMRQMSSESEDSIESKKENATKDRTDELEEILDTKTDKEVKIAVILDTSSDDDVETPNVDTSPSKKVKFMKKYCRKKNKN